MKIMKTITDDLLLSAMGFMQVSLCVKRLVYTNDNGELVKGVCSNFLCKKKNNNGFVLDIDYGLNSSYCVCAVWCFLFSR